MTDTNYMRSLVARIREIADDCFDRRASAQLHALATKIETDLDTPPTPTTTGTLSPRP